MSTTPSLHPRPEATRLAWIFHHRWAVPVLAELFRGRTGGRFAPIAARLGLARSTLRRTLDFLLESGLVRRNPGHGHPLRPEYLLTEGGRRLGPWCQRFLDALPDGPPADAALCKWSMAVLLATGTGCHRFSAIETAVGGITARALTAALRRLQEAGWVERSVHDDFPPRVVYRITRKGRRLHAILEEVPLE